MRFEDDIDDAELLALMDAPTVPRSAGDGSRPSHAKPAAEAPAVATVPPAVDPSLASSLTATLKKFFGHDAFRAGQLDVVAAAVSGRDAAVYWSTGSGKSMCYQIPALLRDGVGIVNADTLLLFRAEHLKVLEQSTQSKSRALL